LGEKEKNNMLNMPRVSDLNMERIDGYEPGEVIPQHNFEEIVGRSAALRAVLDQVETVAPTESTVLILGETGTGKELIARAVHNFSSRQDRPFVNVFPIVIPPLRERREDIPVLVCHFVEKYARRMKKEIETIPAKAMKVLSEHDWPGNIRELENFIERLVILSRDPELELPLGKLAPRRKFPAAISADNSITLEEAQRGHIVRTLRDTNWVIGGHAGAAARLGTKRTTLQYRMKKLGITRPN
jgi:transcriptional regulator with GAF, ATPase, and Fis domain